MNYAIPFIGFFSITALVMFLFRNGNSPEVNRKKIIFVSLFFVILLGAAGFLGMNTKMGAFNHFLILLAVNVMLGAFNHVFISGFDSYFDKPLQSKLLQSLFVSLGGGAVFFFVYNYFSLVEMSPFFISSLFAFFVPMVLMESFEDFISIPDPIYFLWKFDENREVEMVKSDDIMLVTFDIPMNLEASVRKEIKLKAPKSIKFGDFFQMFIENYNATYHQEQIQFKNFNGVPYSWVFFVKPQGFFGSKLYIDPRISISENKINQNHIITIERTDT